MAVTPTYFADVPAEQWNWEDFQASGHPVSSWLDSLRHIEATADSYEPVQRATAKILLNRDAYENFFPRHRLEEWDLAHFADVTKRHEAWPWALNQLIGDPRFRREAAAARGLDELLKLSVQVPAPVPTQSASLTKAPAPPFPALCATSLSPTPFPFTTLLHFASPSFSRLLRFSSFSRLPFFNLPFSFSRALISYHLAFSFSRFHAVSSLVFPRGRNKFGLLVHGHISCCIAATTCF